MFLQQLSTNLGDATGRFEYIFSFPRRFSIHLLPYCVEASKRHQLRSHHLLKSHHAPLNATTAPLHPTFYAALGPQILLSFSSELYLAATMRPSPCSLLPLRFLATSRPVLSSVTPIASRSCKFITTSASPQVKEAINTLQSQNSCLPDTHIRNLFDLSGKVFVVTGGGRGLGLTLAEALAEAGGSGTSIL